MFNRLKQTQEDYISKGGNFVAFEFWRDKYGRSGGVWMANIEGVFDFAELRHLSNVLKNPTSKKKVINLDPRVEAYFKQQRMAFGEQEPPDSDL